VIKKQNFRVNLLAAAVLSMTVGSGAAFAASVSNAPSPGKVPTRTPAVASDAVEGIIVKYRAGTAAASDASAKLSVVNSALTRSRVGGATVSARTAAIGPKVARRLGTGADLISLKTRVGGAELAKLVAELQADPSVQYAVPDAVMRHYGTAKPKSDATPKMVPTDPNYAQYQWNFFNPVGGVNAEPAWDISQGEGVVVAVLDTGILPANPDFTAGTLLEGYDFISSAARSRRSADGRAPGALDYGDWTTQANECYQGSTPEDSSWHGTHVSGTIAQGTNNGVGLAGLAHKAKILPVRVLGRCGGTLADITDAIVWASGGTVAGVPANPNPAEIINMSLGGGGACDASYQDAINGAVSRGTTVVVAAGNDTMNVANARPANCNNVISVGATGIEGGITWYSNYGNLVDLAAPGGGANSNAATEFVLQVVSNSTTTPNLPGATWVLGGSAGTSMAAPHVAGVAAMVQSALIAEDRDPLTPAELEALLKQTTRAFPTTIPANTPIGTGILNAKAALDKALEEPCTEDCAPPATPLTNRVALNGQSGASGSATLYSVEATAGKPLVVTTYGGTGNVSLYIRKAEAPTATTFDAKSARAGNSETVRVTAPTAGTYYVLVTGEAAYSGVSVISAQ